MGGRFNREIPASPLRNNFICTEEWMAEEKCRGFQPEVLKAPGTNPAEVGDYGESRGRNPRSNLHVRGNP
jgi:hypothetical protein